jgi:NAD(P)H dehydrogenase (quinone)
MLFVPMGYTAPAVQFDMSEPHGCSPYGPSTLAGTKGERTHLSGELAAAEGFGERFGKITAALKVGAATAAAEDAAGCCVPWKSR